MAEETLIIVGLGNPGEKYAHTRHNAGFDTLDLLLERWGVRLRKTLLLRGRVGRKQVQGRQLVLCEPDTFMNNSGECVKRLMQRFGCPPENLLVIYDDIDLPPGAVRVRPGGGPGTHNGMRSIISELGAQSFPRIRVGTGDRPKGQDLVDWVLGRPEEAERQTMEAAFALAADCAEEWALTDVDHAMRKAAAKGKEKA